MEFNISQRERHQLPVAHRHCVFQQWFCKTRKHVYNNQIDSKQTTRNQLNFPKTHPLTRLFE